MNELPGGWFSPENIETYKKLVSQVPMRGSVVELGCWMGRSLCSVANEIKSRQVLAVAVDSFTGEDNEVGVYGDVITQDVKKIFNDAIKEFGISDSVMLLDMTTSEAADNVPNNSVDLLFIDADHSYQNVKEDIETWLPKMKRGGVISGHDFFREGVNRALHDTIWPVQNESTIWFKTI